MSSLPSAVASAIALVRRAQKTISRDYLLRRLSEYLARDSFDLAATHVTHHYFSRSLARRNDANITDLIEAYRFAFVVGPLIYRLNGAYRPDWGVGTVLSWFRRSITSRTRQFKICMLAVPLDYDPDNVAAALRESVGIRDELFVQSAAETLANLACSGGRKSSVARLHVDPFLGYATDRKIASLINTKASGPVRARLRAAGTPVGSYLRIGKQALLLADQTSAEKTAGGFEWMDIRDTEIRLGEYIIQWVKELNRLRIKLDDQAIAASLKEIRSAMDRARTTQHRFDVAMNLSAQFLRKHRYATGSLQALLRYDRVVAGMVRRRVTASQRDLMPPKDRVEVWNDLVLPITNPFLTLRNEDMSVNTWLSLWSPYRYWIDG